MRTRLTNLKTDYSGAMSVRNRYRILNHIGSIRSHLDILNRYIGVRGSENILESHFKKELSSNEALIKLLPRGHVTAQQFKESRDDVGLTSLIEHGHLEFHPTDCCNLKCAGCSYLQDTADKPGPSVFPLDRVVNVIRLFNPKAITIAGGGEPSLYSDAGFHFNDLIKMIATQALDTRPAIGLITNGTHLPESDTRWHAYVQWIRFSLDAGTSEIYKLRKGVDKFDLVLRSVLKVLDETSIPKVGVGFVYDSSNIDDGVHLINLLAKRVRSKPKSYINRLNVQFRPWQPPIGRQDITECAISDQAYSVTASHLLRLVAKNDVLSDFVKNNTNIAVNLLCKGAHESIQPFFQCYFGMAKSVLRADGTIYPCFRKAALRESEFCFGNILTDSLVTIALNQAYVFSRSVKTYCISDCKSCFLCLFNNIVEDKLDIVTSTMGLSNEDYFF